MVAHDNGKLKFGLGEWMGLLSPSITITTALIVWGVSVESRMVKQETLQEQMTAVVTKLEAKIDLYSQVHADVRALERRVERIEGEP